MKAVGVFPGRRAVELVSIEEPGITSPDEVKIRAAGPRPATEWLG